MKNIMLFEDYKIKYMKNEETWEFEGNKFKVGKSLIEGSEPNSIYPIVWFRGKIYKGIIKPESKPRISRICLVDIYNEDKKPYWTTIDKVYQVVKL